MSISGQARPDHATLRSISALIASLPASENKYFREEFDTVPSPCSDANLILITSTGVRRCPTDGIFILTYEISQHPERCTLHITLAARLPTNIPAACR